MMRFIPILDFLLAAFVLMNLTFVCYSQFFGRLWRSFSGALASGSQHPESWQYSSSGGMVRRGRSERMSRTVFWSGLINCVGIVVVRLLVVPHLW